MPNFDRYSRQILVGQLGFAGQQQLAAARVLIVGMGGLGCQVGAQLAGAGVGTLDLIDHDKVAASNLHRQILFREGDIGAAKAGVAERELANINSQVRVSGTVSRLSIDNVHPLVMAADLV
ncbi:MAG: hypothetical protein HKN85_01490, partial [Gammaproteobacteria bacterium]|nr:hypothetical protein [Gammaproteobacteria bacterium]